MKKFKVSGIIICILLLISFVASADTCNHNMQGPFYLIMPEHPEMCNYHVTYDKCSLCGFEDNFSNLIICNSQYDRTVPMIAGCHCDIYECVCGRTTYINDYTHSYYYEMKILEILKSMIK